MNNYKMEIEKTAARAWKKMIGGLSEDGINRLTNSGVLNRKKELSGLWRGTNNILKSENAKNIKEVRKFAPAATKSLGDTYNISLKNNPNEYRMLKTQMSESGALGSPVMGLGKYTGGLTHVHKHPYAHLNKFYKDKIEPIVKNHFDDEPVDLKKIPRKDREGRKWADAIMARHEADEVRFGKRVMNSKKLSANIQGELSPLTPLGSHLTPRVLEAEGANLAISPKSTRDMMKSLRGLVKEDAMLKNFGGSNYGSSGVFNSRNARKAENQIANLSKERLRAQGLI